MNQIQLTGKDISLSRLGFGTSTLHHLPRRAARERLINAALDAGFTHFDTAPYYGFGLAETCLGAAFRGTHGVTIATKVGLHAPLTTERRAGLVWTLKALGKVAPRFSRAVVDFRVAECRASLRASLRRLQRDRVDLLFLHEPQLHMVDVEEWCKWLEVDRDLFGAVGVAGEPHNVLPFIRARSPFAAIIQTRDSVARNEAAAIRDAGHPPHITYGHLLKCGKGFAATQTLRTALQRFPNTVILVGTRIPGHAKELARAAEAS